MTKHIDNQTTLKIASTAGCAPSSVRKYIRGEQMQAATKMHIVGALRRLRRQDLLVNTTPSSLAVTSMPGSKA